MKSGNLKRSVLYLLLTLLVGLVSMTSQVSADLKVSINPNPLYWGETCEISVKPYIRKYGVSGYYDPDQYGFEVVNKKYIKSVKNKVFDGRIRIECKPNFWYRKFQVLSPYFVATLPDGQEKVKDKKVYSFRKDGSMALDFVCNYQKPVKWSIEKNGVVTMDKIDKNSVQLFGHKEGRATLTATYLGNKYTAEIRVLPPKNFVENLRDDLEHLATDISVWIRKITGR